MLELAVKKLGEVNPFETDIMVRAKKMLQKCAYAMISQQELSAQQVASYLLDFEDHFTSHSYRNFYWTAFEAFINRELPSPECYPAKNPCPANEAAEADEPSDPSPGENLRENNSLSMDEHSDDENEEEDSPLLNDLAEPSDMGQGLSTEDDDQEIRVSVDGNGNLVAAGSQLADYQQRGEELDGTCVWDFISRVDKVKKTSDRLKQKRNEEDEADIELDGNFVDEAAEDEHDTLSL
ncbi:hypothetical protein GGX14DRAFT_568687 [Mycena pura]|uniref:Uncharacterized protein n=1 Tax=Mycena pura TaxID=153505 RepID=A0AAD6Y7L4_9AGAR|nr:hypothetical protein GGX14DRAFT_568687 [Mycena pura]